MLGGRDRRVLREMEQRNRRDDPAWVARFDLPRPSLRSSWFVLSNTRRPYTMAIVAVILLMAAALILGLGPLAFTCGAIAIATLATRSVVARASVRTQ